MLKVGDRVRCVGSEYDDPIGKVGVVLQMDRETALCRFNDWCGGYGDNDAEWWLLHEELVPVAEATGTDAAPKFKVGDRVKFRDDYNSSARGTEATVVKVYSWGIMVDGVHGKSTEQPSSLRLVAEATSGRFKVGDRVRVHNHPYDLEEDERTGTIISASDYRGDWDIELDNYDDNSLSFLESELTAIPATLTIQAGRYYKTRDGGKVGPMERWDDGEWHTPMAQEPFSSGLWKDNGEPIYYGASDSPRLIAEWVDEQPVNDNSTAGFTIPLQDDEPDLTAIGKAYADGYAAGLAAAA